jgi:hypothetical protein
MDLSGTRRAGACSVGSTDSRVELTGCPQRMPIMHGTECLHTYRPMRYPNLGPSDIRHPVSLVLVAVLASPTTAKEGHATAGRSTPFHIAPGSVAEHASSNVQFAEATPFRSRLTTLTLCISWRRSSASTDRRGITALGSSTYF